MKFNRLICALLIFALFCAQGSALCEENEILEVHFINVDRNDGIFIRLGDSTLFFDGGNKIFCQPAVEYMMERGVEKLDYYVGTHAHIDHIGGAPNLFRQIETKNALYNYELSRSLIWGFCVSDEEKAAFEEVKFIQCRPGDEFNIGKMNIKCIGPMEIIPQDTWDNTAENMNSLVFYLTYGDMSFLLTGDATEYELMQIYSEHPEYFNCTVFKNPHHSGYPGETIIGALQTEYFVFSTAVYALPSVEMLAEVRRKGAKVYITSDNSAGTTVFVTDGKTMEVSCANRLESLYAEVDSCTLSAGQKYLYVKYVKPNKTVDTLYYTTSDPNVAVPDPVTGAIMAISPGSCVITAEAFDGKQFQIDVTVK